MTKPKSFAKLYFQIVSNEAKRFFVYHVNIYAGCLTALLALAGRFALWLALFTIGETDSIASFSETMTFFILADILMVWMASRFSDTIGSDISSGDIAQRLIRPYPYHLNLFAGFHSTSITATITRIIPIAIATFIFIEFIPPYSTGIFILFLLSVILGCLIYYLVDLIISYSAFWLTDFWYLSWFKNALFVLFGGLVVPIWFYPNWLRDISAVLPFQFSIFIPIEIYLGRIMPNEMLSIFLMQLLWVAILFALERFIWHTAQKKLVVQGG